MYLNYKLFIFLTCLAVSLGKKSFTILIDTTSSMQDELDVIKSGIETINVFDENEVENFIVVPFNDPDVGSPLISTSFEGMISSLNGLNVSGGHDCPENSIAGIKKALEVSQQESYIFVFTDADAKDNSKFADIQILCRNTRSQVIIFLSGRCYPESRDGDINVYYDISKACSGGIFKLDPVELEQALKFMKEIVKTEWTDVITHELFTNYKDFMFSVEASTTEFMAAVYGDNVTLHIVDVNDQSPSVETIIDTRHSFVFKLPELKIGNYKISVRCLGTTSVTFYKRNNLPFQYGFATRFPKSLKETSLSPMPGWTNYIVIVLPTNSSIKLDSIELFKTNSNSKSILSLQKNGERTEFYFTTAFFGPDTSFRILVSGKDTTTNQEMVGSTKILETQKTERTSRWTSPSVELLVPENTLIDYGSKATIACKVHGYPKPIITWEDNSGNTLASEDVLLEIPNIHVSYITIDDVKSNMTLYCKAKNSKGEDSQSVEIFVYRPLSFDVKQTPQDETVEYGSERRLYCEVDAYPEATIKWYHNDTLLNNYSDNIVIRPEENMLVILNMSINDAGQYDCDVTNGYESRKFSANIYISGIEAPQVEIENSELILQPGDWREIECITKGTPKPDVTWKFKSDDDNQFSGIPEGVYSEEAKLKIGSVQMKHAGIYRCEATNMLGIDYRDVTIQIQFAPIIKDIQDTSLIVKEGDLVQLGCDVDAMPIARVRWEMTQDDVIIAFDHRHTSDDHYIHRFEALWKDSGKYHCIAENSIGRAEKIVTVNVLVAPYIQTPQSKTITAKAGSSVTLLCNVLYGNPVPITKWEFIGLNTTTTVLSRGNATNILNLKNIDKGQEGSYICIADNEVGADSIQIYLEVQ